jgi:hypothetical protein
MGLDEVYCNLFGLGNIVLSIVFFEQLPCASFPHQISVLSVPIKVTWQIQQISIHFKEVIPIIQEFC